MPLLITVTTGKLAPDSTILSHPEQHLPANLLLSVLRQSKQLSFENSL